MEFFKPVQKTLSSNILHETLIFGRVKLSVLLKSEPLIRKKNHHQQQQNKTSKQTNKEKKKKPNSSDWSGCTKSNPSW